MTGKGSSRQERVSTRITDKADANSDANPRSHNGDDDSEDEEPSLSSVVRLIESFQNETRASIGTLQSTVDSFSPPLTDVESSLQDIDGRVTELEAKCEALSKSNTMLLSKTEDLESRSRCQNLRVLGIPENTEGPQATSFIPNQEPLQVRIFPDFTVDVAKQRAAFTSVQKLRAAEVRYGLLFPARLQLTFNNEKRIFNTPEAAEKYYEEKIAPAWPPETGPALNGSMYPVGRAEIHRLNVWD
ncbi:protein ECT2-like [Scomber scombrus]|uniref:Protein ECT2-like n=1 Tax=Scomber scombrus TaxID=13677 RepID=A0AAV1NXY0_SCOSC